MEKFKVAPRSKRSVTDTVIFTAAAVNEWRLPPFQRERRINDKVRAMAEELRENGGVITGVLTIGHLPGDKTTWLVDGQHRIEAFKISGLDEIIADVRIMQFESMADMAEEFVTLNSQLVKMRPDDVLRGMEMSVPALRVLRERCDFVGYGQVRRDIYSPTLSVGQAIRCWAASAPETPSLSSSGKSVAHIATEMTVVEAETCSVFLLAANAAWGREPENYRLWAALNLITCMWLYRRVVLGQDRTAQKRSISLTPTQFKQCLVALSADADYVDWLRGRNMSERDRRPCYARIRAAFTKRLADDGISAKTVKFPSPPWASS